MILVEMSKSTHFYSSFSNQIAGELENLFVFTKRLFNKLVEYREKIKVNYFNF
jgi:hypothetical protein